ncbi:hypothetical protein PENTCL1PPCAC_18768, partial [Pristionchus entomophagus]
PLSTAPMRLLSSSLLLLLLAVSSSLSAPTEERPSNEDADLILNTNQVQEGSGSPAEEVIAAQNKRIDELEKNYDYVSNVIETMRIEKAETKLAAAKEIFKLMPTTTAAPTTDAAETEVEEKHARDTATEKTETEKKAALCSCNVAAACRKESSAGMDACMHECDNELEGYGEDMESYIDCFKQNNASIVEAENCLFDDMKGSYCSDKKLEVEITDEATWNTLTHADYQPKENSEIKENYLWKKNELKYNKIQNFFQCTKHCMHDKFHTCTSDMGCGVKMPTPEKFAEKMKTCYKKNWKIPNAMILTCNCLAWKNKVKELQQDGACSVIGGQYFIDRA